MADCPIFLLLRFNSCLYLARYWIALSTEIPRAMLKTISVEGFNGILLNPMMAAVINSGIRFGTMDTIIILTDLNIRDIRIEIRRIAIATLTKRLLIRNSVPFAYTTLFPVIVTLYLSGGKIESIPGFTFSSSLFISFVPMSVIWKLTRVNWLALSRYDLNKPPSLPPPFDWGIYAIMKFFSISLGIVYFVESPP